MNHISSFFAFLIGFSVLIFTVGCGGSSQPKPMPENRVEENLAERTGLNRNLNKGSEQEEQKKAASPKKKKKRPVKEEEDSSQNVPELTVPEMNIPANSASWTFTEIAYIRGKRLDLFGAVISELSKRMNNPATEDASALLLSQFLTTVIPGALAKEQSLMDEEPRVKEVEESLKNLEQEERRQNKNGKNSSQVSNKPTQDLVFYQIPQTLLRDGVTALASSTSETAQKQMASFLAGVLQFDDNKSALESAMGAYALKAELGKLSNDEESLLLAFLLTPELAVTQAASFAEVQAPEISEVEYDENGNPIQNQNSNQNNRSSHPQILIAPGQRVQFKFQGGNGNLTTVTTADIQKMVLSKFCPSSSPLFRARIAQSLASPEVLETANTPEKQSFLLQEVLQKFLLKKDFANTIAHIMMYKQPELDDTLKAALMENLALSCQLLMQYHYGFIDEKSIDEYRTALLAKRDRLQMEEEARRAAEESAGSAGNSGGDGAGSADSASEPQRSLLSRTTSGGASDRSVSGNQNPSNRNPAAISPIVRLMMNPEERKAMENELWTPEMRSILFENVSQSLASYVDEGLANMPEPGSTNRPKITPLPKDALQSIVMCLSIPSMETRRQLFTLLDKGWLLGPEIFKQSLFDRVETEPGFLMVVKSLDRRALPKVKEKKTVTPRKSTSSSSSSSRKRTKTKPKAKEPSQGVLMREKRMQVGAAWLDQSYALTCQWCRKFSQAASQKNRLAAAERILDRNAPKPQPPELSSELRQQFPFPRDAQVVSYYTCADPVIGSMSEKDGLKITFFEVRCNAMLTKLVTTFKSKNPHLLDRGVLTKNAGQNAIANAYWLERFEVNSDTGKQESIDILIVPASSVSGNNNQQRVYENPNESQRAKGPENYVVYVLLMEMDDLTGEHVSNLKDDGTDSDREFIDDGESDGDDDYGGGDDDDDAGYSESPALMIENEDVPEDGNE